MERAFKFFSASVLLFVPCYFGYMAQPAEMGLAILAGALGVAFASIDKLSEFSGAGFSAKMKDQVQALVDRETEPAPSSVAECQKEKASSFDLSVLNALSNPKYTWRTLPGISKDADCTEAEAWTVLVSLVEKELVQVSNKRKTGEMIWALTNKGRNVVESNK